jgi:hypothetical protein
VTFGRHHVIVIGLALDDLDHLEAAIRGLYDRAMS